MNDAPTLTPAAATITVLEDAATPSGAVGTLVSSLVGGQADVDGGALQGIAITSLSSASGSWYYSTDGGTNWNAVTTAVSGTSSLLLAADANTRIYFKPNANFDCAVNAPLTFRAWDQTSGSNGDTADTSTNGTTTAFDVSGAVMTHAYGINNSGVIVGACAGPPTPTPSPAPHIGGTLRVGISGDAGDLRDLAFVDPAQPNPAAFMSCCLARTLLAYPGRPTTDGGTILQPDLAAEPPSISRDGLTWTFRLRPGIHYAPPFEGVEVVAAHFIAAVERHARLTPPTTDPSPDVPYGFVVGAADFAVGEAPTISGLSAPDPHTLVIRLREPFGGFGSLLTDPAWAPLPEEVAAGHDDDLALHWPSTGPYMLEEYPADPDAESVTLLRNPSWDRASDPRRGAWVDRIELVSSGDPYDGFALVETGALDLVDQPLPLDIVGRYRADPAFAAQLRTTSSQTLFWIPLNLAMPPFDDAAVRRAVNAVVDRAALRDMILAARESILGPQPPGTIARHVFPDSLTDGLLLTYAPWASPGDHGDLARARSEMAGSRYDTDGDGVCDTEACRGITLPSEVPGAGESLKRDLERIGIEVEVVELGENNDMLMPANRTAIQVQLFGWRYNLTGSDLGQLPRGGDQIVDPDGVTINQSLVGAMPDQLATWGYEVDTVAGVDDLLDACEAEVGHLRARCWAALDQYVTETLVPWVPLFSLEHVWLASPRVASFSLDQASPMVWPALDQVSLKPQGGP